jgi:hypothetical protein
MHHDRNTIATRYLRMGLYECRDQRHTTGEVTVGVQANEGFVSADSYSLPRHPRLLQDHVIIKSTIGRESVPTHKRGCGFRY